MTSNLKEAYILPQWRDLSCRCHTVVLWTQHGFLEPCLQMLWNSANIFWPSSSGLLSPLKHSFLPWLRCSCLQKLLQRRCKRKVCSKQACLLPLHHHGPILTVLKEVRYAYSTIAPLYSPSEICFEGDPSSHKEEGWGSETRESREIILYDKKLHKREIKIIAGKFDQCWVLLSKC